MKATTLEEASQITGYKVLGPGIILGGFSNNNIIDIIETENNGRITFQTMQRWIWDEDPSVFFTLTQNPEIDGIINGTPEQIGNWPGQKRLYPPAGEKPGKLELYWKTEDMAFVLYGIFGGPLDEDTMYEIALSIDGD
jgi:hypothetical protein